MSNITYRKDGLDTDILVLNSGNTYETEVSLEYNHVCLCIPDGYDSQNINISLEYWEEIKAFVDRKIKEKQ